MRIINYIFLFLASLPIFSFGKVVVRDAQSDLKVPYEEFRVYVDESGALKPQEVFAKKNEFSINHAKTIHAMDKDNWVNFDVCNVSNSESFVLEFLDPHINEIEVYVIEKDSVIDYHFDSEGYRLDFDKKVIKHKNHVFDIILKQDVVYTVFARIRSHSESSLSTRIRSARYFVNYALGEYFYLGMFYGIIFIMIVYHLFIYTSTDERSYLYFVFYLFSGAIMTFYEDGLGFQFVWPHIPFFNAWMPYVFRLFLPAAFYFYYSELIELKTNYLVLRRVLLAMVILTMTIELAFALSGVSTRFYLFALLGLFALTLLSSLYLIINLNYRPAYYLLVGNSILCANFFLMLMRTYKIIPSTILTVYSFNFSFVIEAVIFAVALGEKMRQSKDNEISALKDAKSSKDKINKKLEVLVEQRTNEVVRQKTQIEEYNEHLIDGLSYAKRIQESILPNHDVIRRNFNDFGVLNIPRDVVSGDFYWFHEISKDEVILAVGDATGLGVPGGFMSVIANTELNTIVREQQVYSPSQILSIMNKRIHDLIHLNNPGEISRAEHLSLVVCRINKSYKQMDISSANRCIYFVRNDQIEVLQGSRNAIGAVESQKAIYELYHKAYNHNELMYLASDGFADQVSSNSLSPYGESKFREKLISINKLPLSVQEEILVSEFHNWRGSNMQNDDVLVLGVRF